MEAQMVWAESHPIYVDNVIHFPVVPVSHD